MTLSVSYPNSPTMIINGNVVPVAIQNWANAALSAEDLSTYITAQNAQDRLLDPFVSNGSIVISELYVWNNNGHAVTDSVTIGNVWYDTGNVIVGTVANTGNAITDGIYQWYEHTVNGVVANVLPDAFIVNGHNANISNSGSTISFLGNIYPQNDPVWISYWTRFTTDSNVTFPSGWSAQSTI